MQQDRDSPRLANSQEPSLRQEFPIAELMNSLIESYQWLQEHEEDFAKGNNYIEEICARAREHTRQWSLEQWLQYSQMSKAGIQKIYSNFEFLASQGIIEAQNSLPGLRQIIVSVQELIDIVKWRLQNRQKELNFKERYVKSIRKLRELQEIRRQAIERIKSNNQEFHNTQGNLRVFVKIRPIRIQQAKDQKERKEMQNVMVEWCSICKIRFLETFPGIVAKEKWVPYKVDQAFHPDITQKEVFNSVVYFVYKMFNGEKCTLICSGQSGSGKSFTMFGTDQWMKLLSVTQGSGILPRALQEIFKILRQQREKGRPLRLTMQYRQYYIGIPPEQTKPKFGMPRRPGLIVTQEEPICLYNLKDALITLANRLKKRKVGKTPKNLVSSRSHILISLQLLEGSTILKNSQLNFLDLAGNQALSEQQPEESIYINTSLMELKECLQLIKKNVLHPQKWKGKLLEKSLRPNLQDSVGILIATLSSKKVDESQNKTSINFAMDIMKTEQ